MSLKGQASNAAKSVRSKRSRESAGPDLFRDSGAVGSSALILTRLARPKPTDVFATYWRFAKARQDAYFAQLSQVRTPTLDPVIKRHRFTNVYRAADRVSQYLMRHVLYDQNWSPIDLVFRLLIFKLFNKIETWEALEKVIGSITWKNYQFRLFDRCLEKLMTAGQSAGLFRRHTLCRQEKLSLDMHESTKIIFQK